MSLSSTLTPRCCVSFLRLPTLLSALLGTLLGPFVCSTASHAKPSEAPLITTQELREHPERFYVAELTQGHYLVVDQQVSQLNDLSTRVLTGRLNALHPLSVVSSGGEFSREGRAHTWNLSQRIIYLNGYRYESLKFTQPQAQEEGAQEEGAQAEPAQPSAPQSPTLTLSCPQETRRDDKKHTLTLLPQAQASELLKKAWVGARPVRPYSPYRLLRDDWGRYYFVEQSKAEHSAHPFRLWFGYRGRVKQLNVMTVAHDTEGVVLVSSDAAMRLVASQSRDRRDGFNENVGAYWVKEDSRRELLNIPIESNTKVIFEELGMYNQLYLGYLCDPFNGRLSPRPEHPNELPDPQRVTYDLPVIEAPAQAPALTP